MKQPQHGKPHPIAIKAKRAGADQALIMNIGIVLATFEVAFDLTDKVNKWRRPTADDRLYFAILEDWGYTLSKVEQLVLNPDVDAKDWPHLRAGDATSVPAPDSGDDLNDSADDVGADMQDEADIDGEAGDIIDDLDVDLESTAPTGAPAVAGGRGRTTPLGSDAGPVVSGSAMATLPVLGLLLGYQFVAPGAELSMPRPDPVKVCDQLPCQRAGHEHRSARDDEVIRCQGHSSPRSQAAR